MENKLLDEIYTKKIKWDIFKNRDYFGDNRGDASNFGVAFQIKEIFFVKLYFMKFEAERDTSKK